MPETKGITQFDVEVQKQKAKKTFALHVAVIRGPRGKKKMLGEAYTVTPNQPFVTFRVVNANNEQEVYENFLKLLCHRGYLPLRMREVKDGQPGKWKAVSYEGLEGVEMVIDREGPKRGD